MVATLVLAGLIALAGLLGLADSLYFVAVTYGWMAPDAPLVPRACRMDEDTCARIVDTSYGRVFGLPNAAYGAVWYLVVLGLAAALATTGSIGSCPLVLTAAAGTVMFSVYLMWALAQRLDVRCPLCYLAHGLNMSLLVLLALACGLG